MITALNTASCGSNPRSISANVVVDKQQNASRKKPGNEPVTASIDALFPFHFVNFVPKVEPPQENSATLMIIIEMMTNRLAER